MLDAVYNVLGKEPIEFMSAGANNTRNESVSGTEKARDGFKGDCPSCQCERCRNRRYQDRSNDSEVTFQMPTKMMPAKAKTTVMRHEMEHVRREQIKAKSENKVIISQSVRIMNARCIECGTSYVKGGFTRTISRPNLTEFRKLFTVGIDIDKKFPLIGIA